MKKLIFFVILLAGGVWFATQSQNKLFSKFLGYFSQPEPAAEVAVTTKSYNSKQLERQKMNIDDLAEEGSYTILFVVASNCAQCDAMSKELRTLISHRKDIAVRTVTAIRPVNSNARLQEMNFLKQIQDNYNVTTLPMVKVLGPDKKVMAQDDAFGEQGEQFVRDWVQAELKKDG